MTTKLWFTSVLILILSATLGTVSLLGGDILFGSIAAAIFVLTGALIGFVIIMSKKEAREKASKATAK